MASDSDKTQSNIDKPEEVNPGQPGALRRINIDRIVRKIQTDAPITRADLVSATGLSYPTVMKIADTLLENEIVEWIVDDKQERSGRGRPASYMQMAQSSAQVIAISFHSSYILATRSSLDGRTMEKLQCPIPTSYLEILQSAHRLIKNLQNNSPSRTLGLGLAAPGLLEIGIHSKLALSTNIPALSDHYIAEDLNKLTHLPTVLISTMRALYHSEIIRGNAVKHKNFALLSYNAGMGLAVSSNGVFVEGSHGMAGELGHMVVELGGNLCGCGNRGCLETLATDLALAQSISQNLKRYVRVEEMLELIRKSPTRFQPEIDRMLSYLAIAIGATVNIFNPEAIFLYGQLLDVNPIFFEKLKKKIPSCSLKKLASTCSIKKAKSKAIEGAALAATEKITRDLSR